MKNNLISKIDPPLLLKGFYNQECAHEIIGFNRNGMVITYNDTYTTIKPIVPGAIVNSVMEKDGETTTMSIASYFLAYTKYIKHPKENS